MSFASGCESVVANATYDSGERRLASSAASASGMPARNRIAPLTRCRIETMAGSGCRIDSKSR